MISYAKAILTELVKGVLTFGLDRLGGREGGGQNPLSMHPYGLRSRTRDWDTDANGNPTKGAGLLLLDLGGGDEGALPTQDPRVQLEDEGKGGTQLYGWTGSEVSSIRISGDDGKIRVKAPETLVGDAPKALANEDLVTWINTVLRPKLAAAPGGPIEVDAPANVTTTKLKSE